MAVSKFDVSVRSFRGLLTADNPLLGVPHYQRRYAWTKEQVGQLWDDIIGALDERAEQEYFIGAVVFYPDPEDQQGRRRLILDGQQRIATLTIILAALCDHLEQLGETTRASRLHEFIIRPTLREEKECILELRDADGQYLKEHIQAPRGEPPQERRRGVRGRPPKNYLKEAYEHCDTVIQQQIGRLSASQKVERLTAMAEFVLDKITFITTLVDSDTNAYIVFETLNDRGLELSIADLVKNHLFMLGERHGRLRQMQTYWDQVASYLEGLGEKAFSRFLRCYWLSAHERVTQRKLFARIKDYLQDKGRDSVFRFASDLANEASLYSTLIQPAAEDTNSAELVDLRDMGILQHLPLLLAAKSKDLPQEHFGALASVCENVTMRYLIVGNQNPNVLEAKYSEWAIKLRGEGERAIASIRQEARELCPSDDEFVQGFESLSELKTATARYILRKINQHLSGRELKLAGTSEVHVEHILPQNPSEEWQPHIPKDRDAARELAERLGNLTLLDKRLNKSVSNRGFEVKRSEYENSQIKITKELCKRTVWNSDAIGERQKQFAELARGIWAF